MDPLFTAIATLLGEAKTQVLKLQDAEVDAKTKIPGKAQTRDTVLLATDIKMDQVLGKVQDAGDADPENAKTIFSTHQLKILERSAHERDEIEVNYGKKSGTFDVKCKVLKKKHAAYVWLICIDKNNWKLGTFGPSSSGTIDKCGDDPLILGQLYHIKSSNCSADGFSDWSQIVDIYCV